MIKTIHLEHARDALQAEIDRRFMAHNDVSFEGLYALYLQYARTTKNMSKLMVDENGAWWLQYCNGARACIGINRARACDFLNRQMASRQERAAKSRARSSTIESLFQEWRDGEEGKPESLVYDSQGWHVRYGSIVGKVYIGNDKSEAKWWLALRIS
jgi:hypothetical protein